MTRSRIRPHTIRRAKAIKSESVGDLDRRIVATGATAHSESGRWGKSRVHSPAIKGGGAARDRALPMTRLLTTAYSDERSNGVN
jgi:hypothetical protein